MRGIQSQFTSLRSFLAREPLGELLRFPWLQSASEVACLVQQRGVKKQANEVRPGNVLEVNGRLMQVLKYQHTQGAGRQLGNVQYELRDLLTRSKHLQRQRPYDMVEMVRLEARRFQCLYQEGSVVHCMDPENYEQVAVDVDMFGDQAVYLTEGLDIALNFHDGSPVTGEVPQSVTLKIKEAAPTMKGETVAPSYKPAVLENGVRVMVPPFVQQGDSVVVDTAEGTFVRRA